MHPQKASLPQLAQSEVFAAKAFTVGYGFLFIIGLLICSASGWSWDSIKQSGEMLAMGIIFPFWYFPSLGVALAVFFLSKFISDPRRLEKSIALISNLLYSTLFAFFICSDFSRHGYNVRRVIFWLLMIICNYWVRFFLWVIFGLKKKWGKTLLGVLGIFLSHLWGVFLSTAILGFLYMCYLARYGNL